MLRRTKLRHPTLRRTTLATTTVLAALGLASCATPTDSGSQPEQPPTNQQATSGQQDAALSIDQPKNLRAVKDPCSLLTPEQLQQLGETAQPEPTESGWGGPACDWSGEQFAVTVTPDTQLGTGPQQMYASAQSSGDFHPTKLHGYPALHKNRQSLLCRTEVAVSKDASFSVDYTRYAGDAPEMQDSCGYADKIAAEVLKNIPNA
ncbi:DUF3558 domain-containing protein [Bounagaea algeriensis]